MYRWDYDDPDEADPVLQGAYAGDIAHDDGLGEDGVINFLEGAYLNMTFELEGEKVTKNRTFGHIRALQSRLTATTERPQRAAPTGRPGQALGGLFQFLGASGAAANPTTPAAKAQSKKAFGKTPAKKNAPAKAAAPAAAGGKRKERERPPPAEEEEEQEAEAEDDDRAAAGEAGGSGVNSLAQLGADYAGSDDSEAEEPSEKKTEGCSWGSQRAEDGFGCEDAIRGGKVWRQEDEAPSQHDGHLRAVAQAGKGAQQGRRERARLVLRCVH